MVLRPLSEGERGEPVRPIDLDPIPQHVQRFFPFIGGRDEREILAGHEEPHSKYRGVTVTDVLRWCRKEGWKNLLEASEVLSMPIEEALRIWYSGLCDAGIIDIVSSSPRERLLKLERWGPLEGHGLLEAARGRERLAGEPSDLGRAGLMLYVEKEMNAIRDQFVGTKTTEASKTFQYALEASVSRLGDWIGQSSKRFAVDKHSVKRMAATIESQEIYLVQLIVEDRLLRCEMNVGWQFTLPA